MTWPVNKRIILFSCIIIYFTNSAEYDWKLYKRKDSFIDLTYWGRATHICVGKLTIIGSDNGLSPGRRQAIIWNNDGILLIGPYGTNSSEILIEILTFSFTKMSLKVSSAKWRPFCLGLNVLTHWGLIGRMWFNDLRHHRFSLSNVQPQAITWSNAE